MSDPKIKTHAELLDEVERLRGEERTMGVYAGEFFADSVVWRERADKAEAALKVAVGALEMATAFCLYVEQEGWVEPSEAGFWVEVWNLRDAAKDALATIRQETK